jgi:hypothetical protein
MRRLVALAALTILASGLGPGAFVEPGAVNAGVPLTVGRTEGVIECRRYDYETSGGTRRTPQMPCDRTWSIDVVNAPEWTFSEQRRFDGRAGNGITYVQSISQDAGYTMTLDDDGNLTALELYGHLRTTVTHAGNTSVVLDLDIPFRAASDTLRIQDSLRVVAGGHDNFLARSEVDVSLECGGDSVGNRLLRQRSRDFGNQTQGDAPELDAAIETGDGNCVLHVLARLRAANSDIIKSDHDATAEADVELSLSVPPCDLSGVVRDGDAALDLHENPMSGIRVTAYEGDTPTEFEDVTSADGRYCLRGLEPADYELRASLVYETHDPWIFRTTYAGNPLPEVVALPIAKADFARDDLDLVFSQTAERPWRADAANIHWQSTRFVDWLIEAGIATPAELDRFTITALSGDASSNYNGRTKEVHLKDAATPYLARFGPNSSCPENCEWHEIAHHVGGQLGIASYLDPGCTGRVAAHGGWRNGGTCDSVGEGFAAFLAALGSLTIDADRGAGYATPRYANFHSLEDDASRPWHIFQGRNGVSGDEDFAVAELLWDLVDATPAEVGQIALVAPLGVVEAPDSLSLDGPGLVRLMADQQVLTVVDLYVAILDSTLIPDELTRRTVRLDDDRAHDVSPLAAVFLAHDFHPVHDIAVPWYTVGDPIATTARQPVDSATGRPASGTPVGASSPRLTMIEKPGAGVEFVNETASPVEYVVDIDYPFASDRVTVTVGPGERVVEYLELPPYWRGFAEPGVLPPCGAPTDRVVTMTLSGGGAAPRTLTNCEYWQLIAASTSDHALSYPAVVVGPGNSPTGTGGLAPSAAPVDNPSSNGQGSPALLVAIGGAALVAVTVLLWVVLRRRRDRGAAPR